MSLADDAAPGLDGDLTISPTRASAATEVLVSFTVAEPLFRDPVVRLIHDTGEAALAVLDEGVSDRAGRRYGFVYVTTGLEREGARTAHVAMVDVVGVEGSAEKGAVVFDFSPPSATVQLQLPAGKTAARSLDVVGVTGSTEPGARFSAGRLLAGTASLGDVSGIDVDAAGVISGAVDLSAFALNDAADVAIEITVRDEAGNESPPAVSAALPIDDVAPTAPSLSVEPMRTPVREVSAHLAVEGASQVKLGGDVTAVDGAAADGWIDVELPATLTLTLRAREETAGEQLRVVTATFRDDAWNESETVSADVFLTESLPSRPALALPADQTAIKNGDVLNVSGQGQAGATIDAVRLVRADDPAQVVMEHDALAPLVSVDGDGVFSGSFSVAGLSAGMPAVQLEIILAIGERRSIAAESRSDVVTVDLSPPGGLLKGSVLLREESPAPTDPAQVDESFSLWRFSGVAGAAVGATRLAVYADAERQTRLDVTMAGETVPSVPVKADGSFDEASLPDNGGAPYYVVAQDGALHEGAPLALKAPRFTLASPLPVVSRARVQGVDAPVVLVFETDAPGQAVPPSVTVDGRNLRVALNSADPVAGRYTYHYFPSPPDPEGIDRTVVRITDHDDQSGFLLLEGTDAVTMSLDFTPPALDPDLVLLTQNGPGIEDEVVGLAGAASDLIGSAAAPGSLLPMTVSILAANGATALSSTELTDDTGGFPVTLLGDNAQDSVTVALTDAAGNRTTLLLDNDIAPPLISGLTLLPAAQRDGEDVSASFEVSDDASALAAAPVLGIVDGRALAAPTGSLDTADATQPFSLTFTVDASVDAEGPGQVSVVAVDDAGNSSESRTALVLDYSVPLSTLTTPGALSEWDGSGGVAGQSTDGGSGVELVELSLLDVEAASYFDGTAFSSAGALFLPATGTAPWSYTEPLPLVEGKQYALSWRSLDAAGNREPTQGPATFVADLLAPDTAITAAPTDPSDDRAPSFSFSCDDPPCTFACQLDGTGFAPCGSGDAFVAGPGSHTFEVRAVDEMLREDASPASHAWTVTSTVGGTVLGLQGSGLVLQNNGGDDLAIGADGPFTFATTALASSPYDVAVSILPASPAQVCRVEAGAGEVPVSADVTTVRVVCLAPPISLGLGFHHTCAVLRNRGLKCWGFGSSGRLGYGDAVSRGDHAGEMGEALPIVDLGTGVTAAGIAVGIGHSCAIVGSGALKCFGANTYGQLGLGNEESYGDSPAETGDGLPFVDLGTGRTALAVEAGGLHSCAILDGGDVKCWGRSNDGQIGLGTTSSVGNAPLEMGDALPSVDVGTGLTVVSIDAGGSHTCAILSDDTLKCWGQSVQGKLGFPTVDNVGDEAGEMGDALPAVDLGTGRFPIAIALGESFSCAILDGGDVKCWGSNGYGQLGQEDTFTRGVPDDTVAPIDLGTNRTAVALAAGADHVCAILDTGAVKCWGRNSDAQLGSGDIAHRGDGANEMGDALLPVDLGAGRIALAIAAGTSGQHTCAALDDGSLKCWGYNNTAQLGAGHTSTIGDDVGEMGDALPVVDVGP